MHEETLDRPTSGRGRVPDLSHAQMAGFDAGSGEPIPRFEDAARLCRELGLWANVEINPAKCSERLTGDAVARMAAEHWRGAPLQPVLSSFSPVALLAAPQAEPQVPRGLLGGRLPPRWREMLQDLACGALD